jgi:hypothetical protein
MTTQKLFKRRVRERMAKTGERYAAARRQVVERRGRLGPTPPAEATPDVASAMEIASDAKLHEATGKHWLEWIAILDAWGATAHRHGEIVEYLSHEHGVAPWWRQAVTNGYERARGMRRKHQQADGFTVYASKTFDVPLDRLFDAFVDDETRSRWLQDGSMSVRPRGTQRGKVARFDWAGNASRVMVTFEAKGSGRATAHVAHERLPDAAAGDAAKLAWRARLGALKAALEVPHTGMP